MWRISKTISKEKTAALLLYTQLDHDDKHTMLEQHCLFNFSIRKGYLVYGRAELQVFGLFIILLSFKQHPVFFLVE